MVKPKSKAKSNDKNGDKSSKSRRFSLIRSIRSLSARKRAKKEKIAANKAEENKAEPEPVSKSVYCDLKKVEKSNKSKKRQSQMKSVDPPISSEPSNPSSQMTKIPEYENVTVKKSIMLKAPDDTPSNKSKRKNERNLIMLKNRKKNQQKNLGSVFDEVAGPLSPVNAEPRGVEDKMKWKIDVEGVDLNGDQRMGEVLEKLVQLRKKYKTKKCKVLKANEKTPKDSDEDPTEEEIVMAAKVLQLIRMDQLINEKIDTEDQEILRKYCRSGDQEEKAEDIIESITMIILVGVSSKNNFIRNVSVPGQMRMYAVDENKAKLPVMALLMARCDLLYYAWLKPSNNEEELDPTWSNMTLRKVPTPRVVSTYYPPTRGQKK
ncbi:unnamed protein product [Caenorhabditis brenneri]